MEPVTAVTTADAVDFIPVEEDTLPPVEPAVPPGRWMKENLFSSVGSGILTIVFGLIALAAVRGLLNFAFHNPARKWPAVPTNLRLMMTQSYPEAQYGRVWVSLGIVVALAGLTLGIVKSHPLISLRKILSGMLIAGAALALGALAIKNRIRTDENGDFLRDENAEVLRHTYGESLSDRWWVFVIAALLIAVAGAIWVQVGDRRRFIFVPFLAVIYAGLGLFVLSLWVAPYGKYGLLPDGSFIAEKGVTVAESTKMPWLVMWIILGLTFTAGWKFREWGTPRVAALLAGSSAVLALAVFAITDAELPGFGDLWGQVVVALLVGAGLLMIIDRLDRTALYLMWMIAPYFIIFVVLRDPDFDWAHVWSTDLPMFLAFAIVGGAILYFLTNPDLGEIGRIIAFGLVMLAGFHWLAAFFGWYPMLQKARISFLVLALFALAAATFAGPRTVRIRYVAAWVGTIAVLQYMITAVNTPSTLDIVGGDDFIGGFLLTLVLAIFSLTLSFPIGVLLALARTSTLPIFRLLSTFFIEVSRGVPLITVLFFFATIIPLFLPLGMSITKIAAAVVALVLFSAAYVAENIRGGLQSVRRGQFEAADAMGLSTVQRIGLVVLPQGLRVSIPPLVGQAIATYKETSLIAIIGLFDFLLIANRVIPAQSAFIGQRFEPLLFISSIYWIGAYSMSRYSRSLEKRLGVGTR